MEELHAENPHRRRAFAHSRTADPAAGGVDRARPCARGGTGHARAQMGNAPRTGPRLDHRLSRAKERHGSRGGDRRGDLRPRRCRAARPDADGGSPHRLDRICGAWPGPDSHRPDRVARRAVRSGAGRVAQPPQCSGGPDARLLRIACGGEPLAAGLAEPVPVERADPARAEGVRLRGGGSAERGRQRADSRARAQRPGYRTGDRHPDRPPRVLDSPASSRPCCVPTTSCCAATSRSRRHAGRSRPPGGVDCRSGSTDRWRRSCGPDQSCGCACP